MSTLQENLDAIKLDKDTNLKPENLKKGVTCLGVTGIYEGSGGGTVEGVKQFSTIEEMNNSAGNKEGDLAVVYRSEVQNATVDSKFQVATFPDTVVLDTAITSSVEVRYRAVDSSKMFDCWGQLDSSRFMMDCYSDSAGEIRIQYTSSDGITYTRTDTTGNPVDFGTKIYYERTEMWNDAIGKFIQVGVSTFEGLYSFGPFDSGEPELFDISKTQITSNKIIPAYTYTESISVKVIQEIVSLLKTKYNAGSQVDFTLSVDPSTNMAYIYARVIDRTSYLEFQECGTIFTSNNLKYVEVYTSTINNYKRYDYNLAEKSITENTVSAAITVDSTYSGIPLLGTLVCNCIGPSVRFSNYPVFRVINDGSTIDSVIVAAKHHMISQYNIAPTQLTTVANDVYKSIFFGKKGVETGILTENISNSFADNNAEIYNKIKNAYENMEPRVLTDSNKTINKNIYFIPVKKDGTVLLDTSNVTKMNSMFGGCTNLTEIPLLNTSNVTSMNGMFSRCTNLTEIPLLNTSNVTNMNSMFGDCTSLITIPLLDTSNVTDMRYMFQDCTSLTAIPLLDTSKVTNMRYMFYGCTNLTTIPLLDTGKVTYMDNMFQNCTSLSDESLNNILAMCKNATSYSDTKTLAYIGLTEEQANRCKTLSNYSAFTTAGWTTGY